MNRFNPEEGGFKWPTDAKGKYLNTAQDPITGIRICRDCWNADHPREGCKIIGCKCGCYKGRQKSKSGLVRPKEGQESFLEKVEAIEF